MERKACVAVVASLSRSARTCSRSGTPRTRLESERATCVYAGNARTSRPSSDHAIADPGSTVQPARNNTTSAGASRLRRRLSRIFHRAITGSVLGKGRPLASGTVRHSQRATCQSPRTHRCWRAA